MIEGTTNETLKKRQRIRIHFGLSGSDFFLCHCFQT